MKHTMSRSKIWSESVRIIGMCLCKCNKNSIVGGSSNNRGTAYALVVEILGNEALHSLIKECFKSFGMILDTTVAQ